MSRSCFTTEEDLVNIFKPLGERKENYNAKCLRDNSDEE